LHFIAATKGRFFVQEIFSLVCRAGPNGVVQLIRVEQMCKFLS